MRFEAAVRGTCSMIRGTTKDTKIAKTRRSGIGSK
jgi:hypothetical protein